MFQGSPQLCLKNGKNDETSDRSCKKAGCLISFDINYRGKLWTQQEASEVIHQLLPLVDICSAGKMDALYLLGIEKAPEAEEQPLIYYYQKCRKSSRISGVLFDQTYRSFSK